MRVAVITGGNRGLGREVSRQLAIRGFQVVLTARSADDARTAAAELRTPGALVVPHQLDVTSSPSVDALRSFVRRELGRIDVLVNNAGLYLDHEVGGRYPSILEMDPQTLQVMMDVNLYGPLRLIHAFFPEMKQANYGRIVNVSSGMGSLTKMALGSDGGVRRDPRSGPFYRITKTALNALTRITAAEAHGLNILVNAVCPGWVQTRMGGENAVRTLQEGADGIVWAATLPDGGPSGGFFRDGQPQAW